MSDVRWVTNNVDPSKVTLDSILSTQERRNKLGPKLDIYCQGMLSVCGSSVNLNNCHTQHGNILHAAAKYGLAESAKEALAQGYYNMLLELDNGKPNTWPLYYAVKHEDWLTVKVFLETLSSRFMITFICMPVTHVMMWHVLIYAVFMLYV